MNVTQTVVIVAGIGSGGYDAAAQDYFTRAEALGGDFDQSAINAAYTPAYVKAAINAFVAGCKTDSIWTKLTEVYLMAGVNFGGLMAKLKYSSVATLTNVNFVTGDYVGAGSGAGLVGNSTNKSLDTGQTITGGQISTLSFGVYGTASMNTGGQYMGCRTPSAIVQIGAAAGQHMHFGSAARVNFPTSPVSGFAYGYSTATDIRLFRNGVLAIANGAAGTYSGTPTTWRLFQQGSGEYSGARLTLGYYGVANWTDTDQSNLSLRVNTLMTALGANVY